MEVAVAFAMTNMSDGEIRKTWKARKGGRGSPLLLIILHSETACLCGATGDDPSIYRDMDPALVERLCRELLDHSDRHSALRLFAQTMSSFETSLPD